MREETIRAIVHFHFGGASSGLCGTERYECTAIQEHVTCSACKGRLSIFNLAQEHPLIRQALLLYERGTQTWEQAMNALVLRLTAALEAQQKTKE